MDGTLWTNASVIEYCFPVLFYFKGSSLQTNGPSQEPLITALEMKSTFVNCTVEILPKSKQHGWKVFCCGHIWNSQVAWCRSQTHWATCVKSPSGPIRSQVLDPEFTALYNFYQGNISECLFLDISFIENPSLCCLCDHLGSSVLLAPCWITLWKNQYLQKGIVCEDSALSKTELIPFSFGDGFLL